MMGEGWRWIGVCSQERGRNDDDDDDENKEGNEQAAQKHQDQHKCTGEENANKNKAEMKN